MLAFNWRGQLVGRIGGEGLTSFPNGVELSASGALLVADSHGNWLHLCVFGLREGGRLLAEFECHNLRVSSCSGLRLASDGRLVTLARGNMQVLVLEPQRLPGGELLLPRAPVLTTQRAVAAMSHSGAAAVQPAQGDMAPREGQLVGAPK